ncbi:MAG TPA: IPT/TIG domain-containing protein, partial [Candidatus Sulfotelmatobacter sp.]|nr:IPT/TIG domain-containing protein [Candidatus Sulfotelmatobacter sp.]
LVYFGGTPYASFYMKMWKTTGPDTLPVITSINPPSASAGTSNSVTLTGANFGAAQGSRVVAFFYRSGQPKIPATVTAWSDTSITCLVPTGTVNGYSGSAASGPVTVSTVAGTSAGYTFLVPFGYGNSRWSPPGMHYTINENTADCMGEAGAIQAAATAWNNAGANFAFTYDGPTSATTPSLDAVNEMMWGTCPAGVIAQATRWVNTTTRLIVECDIVFNDPDFLWLASGTPSSSQMDIQTIALHEMGHWLCLLDLYGNIGDGLNDNGKVMYGFSGNGALKRALTTADRDGIRWIYGSAVVPGYLTIARNAGAVTLTWTNGILLQADEMTGPYNEVSGAASPYNTAPTAEQKYYRLRYN